MRKNRRDRCGPDLRATRAEKLAMAGELSAARKALENAVVALGNSRTLRATSISGPTWIDESRAGPLLPVGRGGSHKMCARPDEVPPRDRLA